MIKRLFIAGGMTGYPDNNFPAFNEQAGLLRAAGFIVVNPADRGIVPGWAWEDYLRASLTEMLTCDGVAVLPKWSDSKGARLECSVATRLNMPMFYVSEWLRQAPEVQEAVTAHA